MPRTKKTTENKSSEEAKTKSRRSKKTDNPKTAVEPVVAADLPDEKEPKGSEKENGEPSKYKNIGSFSASIENEFAYTNLSEAEEESRTYRYLKKCQKNGEILVGSMYGVVDDPKEMRVGAAISFEPESSKTHYGMVEVAIPDILFFEPAMRFTKDYEIRSEEERYRIRKYIMLQYMGAKIHFCLNSIKREKEIDPNNPNRPVTVVTGDRVQAMEKLRDKYFYHRNRKRGDLAPITIKPGDLVEAFVVAVNDQFVTVVALGVETRIYLHDLTKENITSCAQYTYAGDVLPECRVLSVEVKDDRVRLRLTNNKLEAPKMILFMKRGNYYRGRVTWFNPEKNLYTVYLDNGVTAFVYKSNVQGYRELSINDIVSVCVTSIFEETVGGNAIKL